MMGAQEAELAAAPMAWGGAATPPSHRSSQLRTPCGGVTPYSAEGDHHSQLCARAGASRSRQRVRRHAASPGAVWLRSGTGARGLLLLLLVALLPEAVRAPQLHLDSLTPTCAAPGTTTRRTTEFEYSHRDPVVLWQLAANGTSATVCTHFWGGSNQSTWNYTGWEAPWRSAAFTCNEDDGTTSVEFFPTADCLNGNPIDVAGVLAARLAAAAAEVEDGLPDQNVTDLAAALIFTSGFPLPTSRLRTSARQGDNGTCFDTFATIDNVALRLAYRAAFNLQAGEAIDRSSLDMSAAEHERMATQLDAYRERLVQEALLPARRAFRFLFEGDNLCEQAPVTWADIPASRPLWTLPGSTSCAVNEATYNQSGVDLRAGQLYEGSFACPLSRWHPGQTDLALEITQVVHASPATCTGSADPLPACDVFFGDCGAVGMVHCGDGCVPAESAPPDCSTWFAAAPNRLSTSCFPGCTYAGPVDGEVSANFGFERIGWRGCSGSFDLVGHLDANDSLILDITSGQACAEGRTTNLCGYTNIHMEGAVVKQPSGSRVYSGNIYIDRVSRFPEKCGALHLEECPFSVVLPRVDDGPRHEGERSCVLGGACTHALNRDGAPWNSAVVTWLADVQETRGSAAVAFYRTHNCTGAIVDVNNYHRRVLTAELEAVDRTIDGPWIWPLEVDLTGIVSVATHFPMVTRCPVAGQECGALPTVYIAMNEHQAGLDAVRESQVCIDAVSPRLSRVWESALEEEFTRAFWFARNYSGPPPVETIEAIAAAFGGGEVGEGLDFSGIFKYAVNVGSWPGGMVIGDANFTADEGIPGVEVMAQHRLPNWGDLDLGDAPEDDALEVIMRSVRWSATPHPLTVTLGNLQPGAAYKAQLIFGSPMQRDQDWEHEPLRGQRGFDIFVDGVRVLKGFEPLIAAKYNPRTQLTTGAYVKFIFEAKPAETPSTVSEVAIVLRGSAGEFVDTNPSLHGFTLEYVSPARDGRRRRALQSSEWSPAIPERDVFYITEEEALADTMRQFKSKLLATVERGARSYAFEFGHASTCPVVPPPPRSDGTRCRDTQRQVAGLAVDLSQSWDCSGHGVCEDGVCQCREGYVGAACDECAPGYILDRLDESIESSCVDNPCEPDICSGHGNCSFVYTQGGVSATLVRSTVRDVRTGEMVPSSIGGGMCECNHGFRGSPQWNPVGWLTVGACSECAYGFLDYPVCRDNPCMPDPCSGHGFCFTDDGSCRCDPGWVGDDCSRTCAVTVAVVQTLGEGCDGFLADGQWNSSSGEGWSTIIEGCVRNTECSTALSTPLTPWSSSLFTYARDGRAYLSYYATHNCTGEPLDLALLAASALEQNVKALDDGLPTQQVDLGRRVSVTDGLPEVGSILRAWHCYETKASVLGERVLNHYLTAEAAFGQRYNTLLGPCMMADFTALEEDRQRSVPCGRCLAHPNATMLDCYPAAFAASGTCSATALVNLDAVLRLVDPLPDDSRIMGAVPACRLCYALVRARLEAESAAAETPWIIDGYFDNNEIDKRGQNFTGRARLREQLGQVCGGIWDDVWGFGTPAAELLLDWGRGFAAEHQLPNGLSLPASVTAVPEEHWGKFDALFLAYIRRLERNFAYRWSWVPGNESSTCPDDPAPAVGSESNEELMVRLANPTRRPATFEVTLGGELASIQRPQRQRQLQADVAAVLRVAPEAVQILAMVEGSVVVTFRVVDFGWDEVPVAMQRLASTEMLGDAELLRVRSPDAESLDDECMECVGGNSDAIGSECSSSLRHADSCRYWTLIEGDHNYSPDMLWPPVCVRLPRTFSWDGPLGQEQSLAVMMPMQCPPAAPEPEPEPEALAAPPPQVATETGSPMGPIIGGAAGLVVLAVLHKRRRAQKKRRIAAEEDKAMMDEFDDRLVAPPQQSKEEIEEEKRRLAAIEKRKRDKKKAMVVRAKEFKPLEDRAQKNQLAELGGSGKRAAITQKWAHLYPPKVQYTAQHWTRPPTTEEIKAFAPQLGLDPTQEAHGKLLYLAEAALCAPLPQGWAQGVDGRGEILFFTFESHGSDWSYEHPLLSHFRKLARMKLLDVVDTVPDKAVDPPLAELEGPAAQEPHAEVVQLAPLEPAETGAEAPELSKQARLKVLEGLGGGRLQEGDD